MSASAIFGAIGALAVTFGLLVLTLRLLGRLHAGGMFERRGIPLRVLQRAGAGPRQGLALVQVADRVLVVSTADGGMRLLAELEEPAAAEAIRAAAPASPTAPGAPDPFARFIQNALQRGARRAAVILALALLPAVADAQGTPATPDAPVGTANVAPKSTVTPIVTSSPAPAKPLVARASAPIATPAFSVRPPAPPRVSVRIGEGSQALQMEGAVGLVVFLGAMTLLPAMFLLMTSFTRILIVLHFLRSALGTQSAPPGQLLVAVAVLLTGVVMNPILQQTNREALQPYFNGQITQAEAYPRAIQPFREFMLRNTRESDLATFTELAGATEVESEEQIPIVAVITAFVMSELRTAFQMGFVIFLPFVVVDLIVASVLMSLGMFMLPPVMISLPFKLLLFVLADGWTLVVQSLVASFK